MKAYLYERLFRLRVIAVLSLHQQKSKEQWQEDRVYITHCLRPEPQTDTQTTQKYNWCRQTVIPNSYPYQHRQRK